MLGYYKRAFIKLGRMLNDLDLSSPDLHEDCLNIQLEMIPLIKHAEKKIRYWKCITRTSTF